ncbi:hypothetical protein [Turneriella parva]|uniref:Lipoprotein n=1 Tax=Turneriella parva (strain ATCC BAA-1111 / DSM 21527 / NCTC 11395 / H) TaxID=869212 RepID=I4B9S5_TURPD|nr:hypothetical protein [Turneriella parva]AFM14032.1 hypothetical protein Turpa_3394 [Turneriella parva DSM 21527]
MSLSKKGTFLIGFLLSVLLGGCGATPEQLRRRASFDLGCAEEKIELIELDSRTTGVSGCNKKATYIESCAQNTMWKEGPPDCTWVLNSDAQKAK